jgi:hypothetical protein
VDFLYGENKRGRLFSEEAQHESRAQPIIAVKFVESVDLKKYTGNL